MIHYIDPGTGSMLFTVLIGVISAASYKFKDVYVKAKFAASKGTAGKIKESPDYVIFSDHKRYWNVFEPVCDEFEKRGVQITYMTSSADDPALTKKYSNVKCEFIGEGNKAFAKLNTLHADVLLSTTPSLDVLYWKRSKYVKYYIHIPHAASDLTLYRMFGIDFYDSILTSGDYHEKQIRCLEKVRKLPAKEVKKVGLTFLDSMNERLKKQGNIYNEKPVVLLAPSWGENAILKRFGEKIIDDLLKTGYKIIIRPHPQSYTAEKELMDELIEKYKQEENLEWNRDNDNFEVLRRSDIMISDFSGVMFDFSLVFDKPIIYTEIDFDDAAYDACWLDEEPWTFKVLPKIGMKLTEDNMDDIGGMITKCLNDTSFAAGREDARRETWAHPGEGAIRVADYMINKHKELTSSMEDKTVR